MTTAEKNDYHYFLDTPLVQMRRASDDSTVAKRQLKMEGDGSVKVEQITIVPSDKTEVLVFTKKARPRPTSNLSLAGNWLAVYANL